jgi:hypothetical protein
MRITMKTYSLSMCTALSAALPMLLIPKICAADDHKDPVRIEFHLASWIDNPFLPDEVVEKISRNCTMGSATETLDFQFPGSTPIAVTVSRVATLAISINEARVVLHELISPYENTPVGVEARLELPPETMETASRFRSDFEDCKLFIFVDGKPVNGESPFTQWKKDIPGGAFQSVEDAKKVYARHGITFDLKRPEPQEIAAEHSFWSWRRTHDLWKFHCDEKFRVDVRSASIESYDYLIDHPELFKGISCSEEPKASE